MWYSTWGYVPLLNIQGSLLCLSLVYSKLLQNQWLERATPISSSSSEGWRGGSLVCARQVRAHSCLVLGRLMPLEGGRETHLYIWYYMYGNGHGLIIYFLRFYLFLERGEGGRGRETLMWERNINWLPLACPQPGTWPQPRHVPWPGIEPVTFQFAG